MQNFNFDSNNKKIRKNIFKKEQEAISRKEINYKNIFLEIKKKKEISVENKIYKNLNIFKTETKNAQEIPFENFENAKKSSELIKKDINQKAENFKEKEKKKKNFLKPKKDSIIDEDFTNTEKIKILNLNLQYGNKWTKISSFFKNKTERKVKNQFFSLIRKSLRTVCRIKGISNGTRLLNKIKTQSLATLITQDLEINFEELKKFKDVEIKEEKILLNLFDYVKSFAFLKFSDIRNKIGIKDIFIASKCINFLITIDSDRSKMVYEKQKLFQKNQIFIKNQMLNLNQYSVLEKIDIREKSNSELKRKMISELKSFKEFTNKLILKIKIRNDSEILRKKDYVISDIYKQKLQEKKLRNVLNPENKINFDASVLLLFKKFKKD